MVNQTYKLSDGTILDVFGDDAEEAESMSVAALAEINLHEGRSDDDKIQIIARWQPIELPKRWQRYGK